MYCNLALTFYEKVYGLGFMVYMFRVQGLRFEELGFRV
jgi:hypothetical protein